MTDIAARGYANADKLVSTDWVAEHGNDRVSKFTTGGTILTVWGTPLVDPVLVDVGPDGAVYVGEHFHHRVQKFVYPNEAPEIVDVFGPVDPVPP